MKGVMLIVLLSVTALSWAQNPYAPRDATDEEKLWFVLFARMMSTEIHDDGSASLEPEAEAAASLSAQAGISEAAALEFVRYARGSQGVLGRLAKASHADLCANLQTYETSREAYADKIERDHAQYQAAQKSIVANMSSVLSPKDEEKLRFWALELEPTPTVGGPSSREIADMIRSGKLSGYAERIEGACGDEEPQAH